MIHTPLAWDEVDKVHFRFRGAGTPWSPAKLDQLCRLFRWDIETLDPLSREFIVVPRLLINRSTLQLFLSELHLWWNIAGGVNSTHGPGHPPHKPPFNPRVISYGWPTASPQITQHPHKQPLHTRGLNRVVVVYLETLHGAAMTNVEESQLSARRRRRWAPKLKSGCMTCK